MTLEEQLASVQKAIALIESSGQEIDIEARDNRRHVVRGNLRELYRREAQLKLQIRRQAGSGIQVGIPG